MTPAGRNAAVGAATAFTVGALFLYPTSTGPARRTTAPHVRTGVVRTAASEVVTGPSVDTQYGPVQVQLVVRGHRLLKATAVDFPQSGPTDRQLNSYAVPVLEHETVAAQSAHIDTVSGATYTSAGYRQSLQAALDSAHLG